MNIYPLIDQESADLRAASGRALADVTLDGANTIEDLTIHADTLRAQAEIARDAGYVQLAANLTRAAELTEVPDALILRIYALLRPKRTSYDELLRLAATMENEYHARENALFIRDAAEIYKGRGLLRLE